MTTPFTPATESLIAAMKFEDKLNDFIAALQKMVADHYAKELPKLTPPRIYADEGGKKYIRIVREEVGGSSRSVHCFVEVATGDILKADGWKGPAKGKRGSIYNANPLEGVTVYGAAYRR